MVAQPAGGWPSVVEGDWDVTLTWRGTAPDPAATLEASLLAVLDFAAGELGRRTLCRPIAPPPLVTRRLCSGRAAKSFPKSFNCRSSEVGHRFSAGVGSYAHWGVSRFRIGGPAADMWWPQGPCWRVTPAL